MTTRSILTAARPGPHGRETRSLAVRRGRAPVTCWDANPEGVGQPHDAQARPYPQLQRVALYGHMNAALRVAGATPRPPHLGPDHPMPTTPGPGHPASTAPGPGAPRVHRGRHSEAFPGGMSPPQLQHGVSTLLGVSCVQGCARLTDPWEGPGVGLDGEAQVRAAVAPHCSGVAQPDLHGRGPEPCTGSLATRASSGKWLRWFAVGAKPSHSDGFLNGGDGRSCVLGPWSPQERSQVSSFGTGEASLC